MLFDFASFLVQISERGSPEYALKLHLRACFYAPPPRKFIFGNRKFMFNSTNLSELLPQTCAPSFSGIHWHLLKLLSDAYFRLCRKIRKKRVSK